MQPFVYEVATSQDKEWFPNGPSRVRFMAHFVWLVFAACNQGNVPVVSREVLAEFMSKSIDRMDVLDELSEYEAMETGLTELKAHPQPDLSLFLFGYLASNEGHPDLPSTDTKAAYHWIDLLVRAFDAALRRSGR